MGFKKYLLTVAIFFSYTGLFAQVVDNTSSFKNMNSNNYFRFHYDNDYFTKTDEYYTQGITLEYANPAIKNFILTKLLYKPKGKNFIYGFTLDHYGYTPTSITSDAILYNDRSFCGNLSLKTFLIATDEKARIVTALSVGLMGQGAGGKEMQTTIHRWLKNTTPQGWQNQIKNDVILNYEVKYERRLTNLKNGFLLNSLVNVQLGTHNTKASIGANFMAGHFNSPYKNSSTKNKKVTYYLYAQPQVSFVGYDATLQGGLFNRTSPYTIASKNINRITFQGDYGIVFTFAKMYVEYCQSVLTKEFNTGTYHRWGGVRIGVKF